MNCLLALCLSLSLGTSYESTQPPGTWWVPDQPSSFHHYGPTYGVGLVGENWSLQSEQLGKMKSDAWACPSTDTCPKSYLWSGTEHPHGVWASWEPHRNSWFGQLGLGVAWPQFEMHSTSGYSGSNNHPVPSPLIGGGYRAGPVDFLINAREVRVAGSSYGTQGLGWKEITASVRWRF